MTLNSYRMILFIKLGVAVSLVHFALAIKHSLLSRKVICGVDERIKHDCSVVSPSARSLLECMTFCGKKETCLGASMSNSLACYNHEYCPEVTECREESTNHEFFAKSCENNGVWNSTKLSCICVDGWVGKLCNQFPKSCDDLIDSGYKTGSHRIELDLSDDDLPNVEVICFIRAIEPTYSYVILMKNGGKEDHSLDWSTYTMGYKMGAAHYWLGLDTWHILSNAGYNTFTFKVFFYVDGVCEYKWNYYNFKLLSDEEHFTFSFDDAVNVTNGCVNTAYRLGDCFGKIQNIPFSTWDEDHDGVTSANCAEDYGAGWWYDGCPGTCHILGWGQYYAEEKLSEHLIDLVGIDMSDMPHNLMLLEMFLDKP